MDIEICIKWCFTKCVFLGLYQAELLDLFHWDIVGVFDEFVEIVKDLVEFWRSGKKSLHAGFRVLAILDPAIAVGV